MKIDLDKIGMIGSQLCGWHCLLMPFLFVLFPFASVAFVKGEIFEWTFILFSLALALFSLTQGFLLHKKKIPMFFASIGFFIFIFTKLKLEHSHETFSGSLIFVFAGSMIFLSHYFNHKFTKHIHCECDHE